MTITLETIAVASFFWFLESKGSSGPLHEEFVNIQDFLIKVRSKVVDVFLINVELTVRDIWLFGVGD